ncbi:hypothetical protein B0T26DRAFT_678414 [Lasiosphaeria miniovina]|uniref:F-box domain-containing protein n=1 Tax=Lasiosphaeria miniovina TaxID=1954250 RepID=A0AA40AEG4_9PEZI|nr:uncharacterized protein B0T26DRAFT_678414 [Lasiosphaeria miniovina]KAK0714178.1 hypothetical protein B0T26DRAFT_678414 [Lasiosphaeria miniovina]
MDVVLERPAGPASLATLPTELLRAVFGTFTDGEGKVEELSSLQSVRLVCRQFNQIAAPALLSRLRVYLDQPSLDWAAAVSHSSLVASGEFALVRVLALERAEDACRRFIDGYHNTDPNDFTDERTEEVRPGLEEYEEAKDNFGVVGFAWRNLDVGPPLSPQALEYQRILRAGHAECRRRYGEQQRLVGSREFVDKLASAVARMPHASRVVFRDRVDRCPGPYEETPTQFLADNDRLFQVLASPLPWAPSLDGWAALSPRARERPETTPARILSELPIALHNAGAHLRQLGFGCFPVEYDYHLLEPRPSAAQQPTRTRPAWDELAAACQHLEAVSFGESAGLTARPVSECHLPEAAQQLVDSFFGSVLSGQRIETLTFAHIAEEPAVADLPDPEAFFPLTGALAAMKSWLPCMRVLSLVGISATQEQLERLCEALPEDQIERIVLCEVKLRPNGGPAVAEGELTPPRPPSWARILDVLREKCKVRYHPCRCRATLLQLRGGEYGDLMQSED